MCHEQEICGQLFSSDWQPSALNMGHTHTHV
jgi:hypothetical protein